MAWLEKDASEIGCQWPVPENYQISAFFGSRVHPVTGEKRGHSGVDIAAPEGTPVLAALGGVVVASGFDAVYGNYVELTHENGLSTLYAQLSARGGGGGGDRGPGPGDRHGGLHRDRNGPPPPF